MTRGTRQRQQGGLNKALLFAACLIWGHVGFRVWSVARVEPQPKLSPLSEVSGANPDYRVLSGSKEFTGDYRDPFAEIDESALMTSDDDVFVDRSQLDHADSSSTLDPNRFKLIGLVDETAIVVSEDKHPLFLSSGDTVGGYQIRFVNQDGVVLGSTEGQVDLSIDYEDDRFRLTRINKKSR